jgi:hypothetical protein
VQVRREGGLVELSVDVSLGSPRAAAFGTVSTEDARNLPIQVGAFRVRQKLSGAVLHGPLQGHVGVPGPMPWRSGSPHGVFGAGPLITAAVGALPVVVGVWQATLLIASETTTRVVAIPTNWSSRGLIASLLRVLDQSAGFVPPAMYCTLSDEM